MISNRTDLVTNRAKLFLPLALHVLLFCSASVAAEELGDAQRIEPTAAERLAFKSVGAQSNMEMRLALSTTPAAKQRENATKRLLKKIAKPIEATWAELSHPSEIVKFAQHLLRLDSPAVTWADNFTAGTPAIRAFDFGVAPSREVSVASVVPPGASRMSGMSLNRYVETPSLNETFQSSVTQQTATQLQFHVRRDWTLMYELNRTSSAIYRDEIGVGFGVRHSF